MKRLNVRAQAEVFEKEKKSTRDLPIQGLCCLDRTDLRFDIDEVPHPVQSLEHESEQEGHNQACGEPTRSGRLNMAGQPIELSIFISRPEVHWHHHIHIHCTCARH